MKNLSIYIIALAGILAFASCDKGNLGPVVSSNPGTPNITEPSSGQSYTLQESNAKDTLFTMKWTNPDYGFPAAPLYHIEMDSIGNNFADAISLANINGTSYSITVGDMNSKLLGTGYPANQKINMEFRVTADVADSVQNEVSDPINMNLTPYSVCKYCPAIYVPGGYQSASGYTSNDWSPADAPALATVSGQDVYEGYVYIANGGSQFKFTADQSWTTNWGDNGADGTLEINGANIVASNSGYYKMNVDLNALTYTLTNTTWGVIGDSTPNGWNSDQNMTYDPATKMWSITLDLTAGGLKFRANDAWNINYGDTGSDGTLEQDGDNISISSAGNYTIKMDLNSHPYTYSITKN